MSVTTGRRPTAVLTGDPRLDLAQWGEAPLGPRPGRRLPLVLVVNLVAAVWYFTWLLSPERIGNVWLFGVLLVAELFNLLQAAGFWWTVSHQRRRPRPPEPDDSVSVDVLVPVYGEPVSVVEPTVAAAARMQGARVQVHLLDDGDSHEMAEVAARNGVRYLRRTQRTGAKAGNINHALATTDAEFVAVFDCDHVPHVDFLRATVGHFEDDGVAFVQTPQYYANTATNAVAAGAWSQQALFFGCIGRGKDGLGAMFCCGTNVVFRRSALEQLGGFPETSLTEDFELSLRLHERGWRSVYVAEVLAQGLGPEDMASYVSQQLRWARGCLSAIASAVRASLPWRHRLQYLLSSLFFLSGWTFLIYMTLPVLRLLFGMQPVAGSSADQFLLHFGPYYAACLVTVAVAGGGTYTFRAFAQTVAFFWLHVTASVAVVLRRRGRFVVTPKQGSGGWQPGAVWPTLLAVFTLLAAVAWGLAGARDPATLNNASFIVVHVVVLLAGSSAALQLPAPLRPGRRSRSTTNPTEPALAGAAPGEAGDDAHVA